MLGTSTSTPLIIRLEKTDLLTFAIPRKRLVGFDSCLGEAPVCVLPIAWQHSTWA